MRKLCDVDEVRKCLDEVTGDDSIYAKGLLEWAIKKEPLTKQISERTSVRKCWIKLST